MVYEVMRSLEMKIISLESEKIHGLIMALKTPKII